LISWARLHRLLTTDHACCALPASFLSTDREPLLSSLPPESSEVRPAAADVREEGAAVASPGAPAPRARAAGLTWLLLLLLLATIAALAWVAVQGKRERDALTERVARVEAEAAAAATAAERRARTEQLAAEKLQGDLERLQNQRTELDQLYVDLTRGRDEAALVEIERLIAVAAQELQISGNIATAVAALQAVDGRLAHIDRPQLVNLRRAIARDLDRLRAAPAVDVTGLAVKLDQMINAVDGLALVAEPVRQPTKATEGKAADAKAAEDKGMEAKGAGWWIRTRAWLRDEFGELVRIRQVDTPEALLLNEQQQRLARQQLRLRLLNARQSLLQRNDRLYRADLAEAQTLLARYYDGKQPNVVAAAAQLKAMAQAPLSIEVPQITDSLAALQGARSARGSR
jgi:uncharacterized protein HemX